MTAPGTRIKLTLFRKGELKTIDLVFDKMPNKQQAKADTGSDESATGLPPQTEH
jgi:serine protease Do